MKHIFAYKKDKLKKYFLKAEAISEMPLQNLEKASIGNNFNIYFPSFFCFLFWLLMYVEKFCCKNKTLVKLTERYKCCSELILCNMDWQSATLFTWNWLSHYHWKLLLWFQSLKEIIEVIGNRWLNIVTRFWNDSPWPHCGVKVTCSSDDILHKTVCLLG